MTLYLTAAVIFILDRVTKYFIINILHGGQSIKVFEFFHITLIFNTGTAFGLLKGQNTFFITLSVITTIAILFYSRTHKLDDLLRSLALGLILGGAAGNLVDRIKFGYVIDFLDFRIWPVFNVADSAITIGMILLCINILLAHRYNVKCQSTNDN